MGTCCWVIWISANSLSIVDHSGKDENTESQEDDEQEEFVGAGAKGVTKNTETHKMACQFEDTEDTDKSDNTKKPQNILGSFGGQTTQSHLQVEGQDGNKVDDVEGTFEEFQLVWTEDDSQQDLNGEPNDAYTLHVCQPAVGYHLVDYLFTGSIGCCDVFCFVCDCVEGLVRLHAESRYRDQDEEEGNKSHILEGRKAKKEKERKTGREKRMGEELVPKQ